MQYLLWVLQLISFIDFPGALWLDCEAALVEQLATASTAPTSSKESGADNDGEGVGSAGEGGGIAGNDDDSGAPSAAEIEEQRALLKIKRARALRLVQALSAE